MKFNIPIILLIGCGPHAKRVYLPFLKESVNNFGTQVRAIIELKEKESDVLESVRPYYSDAEFFFVEPFGKEYKHSLPLFVEEQLNKIVKTNKINGVIIATDPLNHMQYALWAEKQGLHILMDKPLSTYENISNSEIQAKKLITDFDILLENYSPDKVFIINAQRRFLPQFELIQSRVNDVAKKYGMPVTSMQSTHSDGQWRLPNEVLTLKYHPHLGWGKISHSGYHFIDMAGKIVKDSFISAGKQFDQLSTFSQFIRAQGILKQQSQSDLVNIFGQKYYDLDSRTDAELAQLFSQNNEAEVDVATLINLSHEGIPITNVTLNLIHNGFSRRAWMLPSKDLYKGNGRIRHEYHNIEQGPLQNIQVHSYQSSDECHDQNTKDDFNVGGNNHYDIHIYRNVGIIGGDALEIITAKDIAVENGFSEYKSMNVLARHKAISEFLEAVTGMQKVQNTRGCLTDCGLSVQLMSMIYESGIKNVEIQQPFKFFSKQED